MGSRSRRAGGGREAGQIQVTFRRFWWMLERVHFEGIPKPELESKLHRSEGGRSVMGTTPSAVSS